MKHVLGLDVGGVLTDRSQTIDTSLLGPNYLRAPSVVGAFDAVTELVKLFEGRVHIVSKCGTQIERRTREWLEARSFHEMMGIPKTHLHFVRTRIEKTPVCRDLGITCFVDDHQEVLAPMAGIVPIRVLFAPGPTDRNQAYLDGGVIIVENWPECLEEIRRRVSEDKHES